MNLFNKLLCKKTKPFNFKHPTEIKKNGIIYFDSLTKNNISDNVLKIIKDYTDESYHIMNAVLRNPDIIEGPDYNNPLALKKVKSVQANNNLLSNELQKHKIHKPLVVYKSISESKLESLMGDKSLSYNNLKGTTLHDKGFVSTSLFWEKTLIYNKYLLKINIPAGTKGAFLEPITSTKCEYEILLDKDQKFIITRASKVYNRIIIHCNLLPKN
jgi:hypothetical protein